MSGTGLDHRLVRDYLRDLDAALARLPADEASELREQITTHLDDALPPDADDQTVAAVLARLGSAAELAAEAASPVSAADGTSDLGLGRRRSFRARLARLGRRRQIALALVAVFAMAAITYDVVVQTAPPLQYDGAAGWWFAQDRARQVYTSADGATQSTVPIRSGQQQGYFVDLYNPSNLSQTVLGAPTGPNAPTDSIGDVPKAADVSVSAPNRNVDNGSTDFAGVKFVLPGVIPPHQLRAVRVLWTSITCLDGKGSAIGSDTLVLRVRIGWIVRIETIPLLQGWYLAGPSHGKCI
jgi:hypothetical protein